MDLPVHVSIFEPELFMHVIYSCMYHLISAEWPVYEMHDSHVCVAVNYLLK